eukprot:gb/GECG01008903.1/.p1 GENE.gb/GECG01008903.1/~~gb/GECG01008903.1/.p1  ORF type:complete len:221 (+),score=32.83 gb/GECG01008903.1/:1-663(+)
MLIPLRALWSQDSDGIAGDKEEFALLELQGSLECTEASQTTNARVHISKKQRTDTTETTENKEGGDGIQTNTTPQKSSPASVLSPLTQTQSEAQMPKNVVDGNAQLNGVILGKIISLDSKGNPTLVIGGHRITGRIETLSKPQIIVQKVQKEHVTETAQSKHDDTNDADVPMNEDGSRQTSNSFVVRGVVRKKLVFTDRPQPLIGSRSLTEFYSMRAEMA